MFDQAALKTLMEQAAIKQANDAIATVTDPTVIALPSDYKIHDLERYLAFPRRITGVMTTSVVNDFSLYIDTYAECDRAACFVDPDAMQAWCALNFGTIDRPGHADHVAIFKPRITAAFAAFGQAVGSLPMTQQRLAEFIEDWSDHIAPYDAEGVPLDIKQAVSAIRKITIESMSKAESNQQNLSAERSTFDAVRLANKDPFPAWLHFTCAPYVGLAARTIACRVSLRTPSPQEKEPTIKLAPVAMERHVEEMGAEVVKLVTGSIDSVARASSVSVTVGKFAG